MNESRFLSLLEKFIGEAKYVQNNPPDFVPEEDRIVKHVLDVLKPLSTEHGGPLKIKQCSYTPGRSNLLITYPGKGPKTIGFVGSHMDVVTANPAEWEKDPFKLTVEGDKLYGRGTTDCLGHVAMITDLMAQLAEKKPELEVSVMTVFICNEENSSVPGIGVDELVRRGELDVLREGTIYWVDSADEHPCIGTGGVNAWELTAFGKIGHSGLPHNAINPIILGYEAVNEIMRRFHAKFPAHPEEKRYNFPIPSTMKPTMVQYPKGSLNQIPGQCTFSGDVRLTPFYSAADVMKFVTEQIEDMNTHIDKLPTQGPVNSYVLKDGSRGRLAFKWLSDEPHNGVACNIDGKGFKLLKDATDLELRKHNIANECTPSSLTGSLPCVRELQEAGFDLQICGYGVMKVYHACNEYATISGLARGWNILNHIAHNYKA